MSNGMVVNLDGDMLLLWAPNGYKGQNIINIYNKLNNVCQYFVIRIKI
jgi:hypothetical protein